MAFRQTSAAEKHTLVVAQQQVLAHGDSCGNAHGDAGLNCHGALVAHPHVRNAQLVQ